MTDPSAYTTQEQTTRGLALVLWATRPEQPELCAGPFMYAAAAAAMDLEVEIHFTAQSILLLRPGLADALYAGADRTRSIAMFMRDAREHGAKFLACTAAMQNFGLTRAELEPVVDGFAGASSVVGRLCRPDWRVLVF